MEHKELVTKALQLLPSLLALEVNRIAQEVDSGVAVESVDQVLGSDHDSMRRVSEACVTYVSFIEDEAKRQAKKPTVTTDSLGAMISTGTRGTMTSEIHREVERRLRDTPVTSALRHAEASLLRDARGDMRDLYYTLPSSPGGPNEGLSVASFFDQPSATRFADIRSELRAELSEQLAVAPLLQEPDSDQV